MSDDLTSSHLADLRRAAREGAQAKKQMVAMQRELTLRKAGVDDSGLGKLFLKAYDGDLDVDTVRAEWDQCRPKAPEPVPVPLDIYGHPILPPGPAVALVEGEDASSDERARLSSGGSSAANYTPDPRATTAAAYQRHIAEGGTAEDGLALMFDGLVQAAIAGDTRVIIDNGNGRRRP